MTYLVFLQSIARPQFYKYAVVLVPRKGVGCIVCPA